jgi:hypothetical protein
MPRFVTSAIVSVFLLTLTAAGSFAQNGDSPDIPRADQFFAGFGPAVLDNLGAEDVSYQFFAGKFWELFPAVALKAIAEATTDFNEAVLASGNVGLNLYPITNAYSPFIGGSIGVGYGRDAFEQDAFGMNLAATFGLLLFRTTNTQVSLETNANMLLRDFQPDAMPLGFSARVGVLF